ncbi:DMT family transporter [Alteromonas facilis]|uniref:DMT family transporter n=1 Tax=Alteromonas facilis TaxID=2048004 RepID=UPI000C28E106|nr:DMT family transporter [Alteromonas facilis]
MSQQSLLKLVILTGLALIAFAANSVLSRLALDSNAIDAASYTIVRLVSGAAALAVILSLSRRRSDQPSPKGSWLASFMLFLYAVAFSYAYLTLETGTGALILFGSVQITMILLSIYSGARVHLTEWVGISIAFAGFLYLVIPNVSTPSLTGFVLMTVSGIAWGVYTLQGRGSKNPLSDTTYNFVRTTPFVIILAIFALNNASYSTYGVTLAILSGTLASGVGYTIWYSALTQLKSTQAAVLQLLVPVIAALGGVIFVSEPITLRLFISGILVLGGVLVVIMGKSYWAK